MNLSIPKGLKPLVRELQALKVQTCDASTNIKNVSLILKYWISKTDWLEEKYFSVDTKAGFSSWLIHEEDDHTLAINLVAWQPGREIVPHDHKTWGVVGSVIGIEKNYFWLRKDNGSIPGYADIVRKEIPVIRPAGELIGFMPDTIHSVVNESEKVAISLHIYGKNLNYTGRNQYDPEKKTVKPFLINFS